MAARKAATKTTTKAKPAIDSKVKAIDEKIESVAEQANQAMDELDKKIDFKFDSIQKSIEMLAASMAKNNPVDLGKKFEPMEQDFGTEDPIEFSEDNIILPRNGLKDVDSVEFKAKEAATAFYNEPVTVQIHETNEKFPQRIFNIMVNGKVETFVQGETKTVKRMFVEGLARAKPVHFGNEEYVDWDGTRKVRHPTSRGLRHPFSVVHDPNRNGAAWLKAVLAQP